MTLEEAKKILEKEFAVISLHKSTEPFEFDESGWIEHEKPSVLEAFRVLSKGGYYISISGHDYDMRKKRLQKEYEKNAKAPGSSENRIKEDSGVNPALKESASQFNDALLDEQAKKIKRLGKEITRLNKIIHKKNEELRLTKIREKNLAELGLKYVGENEKLKKKLADKVVDKIDAQALKSAESALAYKEKVIAEKDEVIADLGNELAATKKELEGTNNLVRMVRNASKEYCEYGIAAEKMIQKLSKIIVSKGLVPSDVFEKCRLWAKGYRFNPQLPEISEEEEKKLTSGRDTHPTDSPVEIGVDKGDEGGDYFGKIVICGKDFAKILKENEEAAEELFKVLDDVIAFMSVESKQLFEGDGIPTKMEVMEPSRKFKKR